MSSALNSAPKVKGISKSVMYLTEDGHYGGVYHHFDGKTLVAFARVPDYPVADLHEGKVRSGVQVRLFYSAPPSDQKCSGPVHAKGGLHNCTEDMTQVWGRSKLFEAFHAPVNMSRSDFEAILKKEVGEKPPSAEAITALHKRLVSVAVSTHWQQP
jgi:hypothetical protein